MEANKSDTETAESPTIEAILREHDRLEQVIQETFRKEASILFTDICGYTHYMETRGDIQGRAMLQKHNDIVMPLVEQHNGVVIKTIGDAVMATFQTPADAVRAAADIQRGLDTYNGKAEPAEEIHVKIGVNAGYMIVDDADVFGDAVNVAARIQAKAGKDEILMSETLFEQVCGTGDFLCRFHDTTELKGKAEPVNLYRVIWRDEDVVLSKNPQVRSHSEPEAQTTHPPSPMTTPEIVLHLEVARVADQLKISAYEQFAGESGTVRHYEEMPIPIDTIDRRCREIVDTLNKANRRGCVSRDILVKLREIGQIFFDDLFTHAVKKTVRKTGAEHLILNLDDTLVHIPWELLHDGQQFLCLRFSMGRLVRTKQQVPGGDRARALAQPLKMLILADPGGDLNGAYSEGIQLRDYVDQEQGLVNASLRTEGITSDYIREKIRNFDVVHYAGHSDYDGDSPSESGWRLSGGRFRANEIMKMAGTGAMPSLIFSNACQSARTEGWEIKESFHDEIFGLANAFVLAGVKHYVGTFWEVLDQPSRQFALEFYRQMLSGMTVGQAARHARVSLIREYGEETIVWASYLLYGDPTFNYVDAVRGERQEAKTDKQHPALHFPGKKIRARDAEPESSDIGHRREAVIDFSETRTRRKISLPRLGLVASVILLLFFLLWGYPKLLKSNVSEHASAALSAYHAGAFEDALTACKTLEEKNPQVRLTYLIRGDIYLRQGKLDDAQTEYRQAMSVSQGTDEQKAGALMGLGRIAAVRKQTDAALDYYRQATDTAPASGSGYLSTALLLNDSGNYQESLELLVKAQKRSPENHLIVSVIKDIRKKMSVSQDQEKQARIDTLVKDLLESEDQKPETGKDRGTDPWTSVPMTLWMMDFDTRGYAMQEGEAHLLGAGIADALIEKSRFRLVERALLDTLLRELKLGTSKLMDRNTALSLGRLLAARLILFGQIIHAGPQTQVSLRVFETETGQISTAISKTFGGAVPGPVLADALSENLLSKLRKHYPLRGVISEVNDNEMRLNIGEKIGVAKGQQFRVINEDVMLEVISADRDTSIAKVVKGEAGLAKGQRIEGI